MLRKILCNYEFSYHGNVYRGYGIYLGDTANHRNVEHKDFSSQVVCLALKHTEEELGRLCKCKYWDITRKTLEATGLNFRKLEIFFYPEPKKGER